MKRVLVIYAVLIAAIIIWYYGYANITASTEDKSKLKAITVSKHSPAFNASVEKVMNSYYNMTEGFVKWDTTAVNKNAKELKKALDQLKMEELKKDTMIFETANSTLDNIKNELSGLISDHTIETKRESLNLFSNQLYDFLRTIHYDIDKVYLQECPMAFNEETPGNWLSRTDKVRNPYLGTNHPKYHSGMLDCGGPKDTLNFMVPSK
jgi:uncharacterized protein (UPF0333 family)